MPYDDIRFSHWDEPDDDIIPEDDICPDCGYEIENCACWDDGNHDDFDYDKDDYEFMREYECRTCGKEVTYIDDKGDCSWCRMVNNS